MRECRTYGSVRGALGNERPYRDQALLVFSELALVGGVRFLPSGWNLHPTAGAAETTI